MTATNLDNVRGSLVRFRLMSTWPANPQIWYGEKSGGEANEPSWKGGEMMLYTPTNKLFIQTATSGTTPTWEGTSASFATTTSTSTTTSSSTSTSTSTSSTTTA